jgi:hypothetical protein
MQLHRNPSFSTSPRPDLLVAIERLWTHPGGSLQ